MSDLERWTEQALEASECRTSNEVIQCHGEPSHKETTPEFEIWHFPLGTEAGRLYSIHVSVWPDHSARAYLHSAPLASGSRPWWRFW